MILFLSRSFLRRFHLVWRPQLQGFLIGTRNLFFFIPDSFVESSAISPEAIDEFLQNGKLDEWELLGVVNPEPLTPLPGYVSLMAGDSFDPQKWIATISLYNEERLETRPLQIRM